MTREPINLFRCPSCNRILEARSVEEVRSRHAALVERSTPRAADFVREATWGAYLAAMKRCRCGSRRRLAKVEPGELRGQLGLVMDPVVIQ